MMPKTRDGVFSTMYQRQAREAEAKLSAANERIEELEAALQKVRDSGRIPYVIQADINALLDTEAKL